jgi:hypothetical protein
VVDEEKLVKHGHFVYVGQFVNGLVSGDKLAPPLEMYPGDFFEHACSQDCDVYSNNADFIRFYPHNKVKVHWNGVEKLLTEHPKYETWKNEMDSGELVSLFGCQWVSKQSAICFELISEELSKEKQSRIEFFEIVQVGDFVDSNEDAYYLCGNKRQTKNKLYEVKEIDVRRNEHGEAYQMSVIVDSDYQEKGKSKNKIWLSPNRVIYRNGELVWESYLQKAAKICLELEKNLSQSQIEKLKELIFDSTLENVK